MKAGYVSNMTLAWSLMLSTGLAQAVMNNYIHNLADREAATGSFFYENYTGNIIDSGISFTSTYGSGFYTDNQWQNQLYCDSTASICIEVTPVTGGDGHDWNTLRPIESGTRISLTDTSVNGMSHTLFQQVAVPLDDHFTDFTSATALGDIALSERSLPGNVENYWLENEVYGEIPEPATLALLGIGLVVISLFNRKKRR